MAGFKLGVIRLGKAAGKIKYSLLDEQDVSLIRRYGFQAHVDMDRDGNGAKIYAYAYDLIKGKSSMQSLHNMLWEKYRGGIAPGFKVVHMNGITVDNRLDNLALIPEDFPVDMVEEPSTKSREQSLYWLAVQQLHIAPLQCQNPIEIQKHKFYDNNGHDVYLEEDSIYYECHYPPCTNMEKHIRQFSICGRCQQVRYCGTMCQQQDWPVHKTYCIERPAVDSDTESLPDR